MKKLGKLSINLNKVMKNEELVNLRGGYGGYGGYGGGAGIATCQCKDENGSVIITDTFDVGCSCDYQKLDRWVKYNCWQEHWTYSSCSCDPCV